MNAEAIESAGPTRPPLPLEPDWVPPSWEQVVREHAERVYRLAYRLSGSRSDAEDLTQETFVRVFRSLADYSPGTFEGWLYRITTNLFLDMVRRRQRIRFEPLPDDPEQLVGTSPTPDEVYADSHLDPRVTTALDALPAAYRVVVVLSALGELTHAEIAAALGIKRGTVGSRLHRGRRQLRMALPELAPGARTRRTEAVGRPGTAARQGAAFVWQATSAPSTDGRRLSTPI